MLSLQLGYPSASEEVEILDKTLEEGAFDVKPILTIQEIIDARKLIKEVRVDRSIKNYIVAIATATRKDPEIVLGVSPRGSQLLMRASQASAYLHGRDFVIPEDTKTLAPFVFGHRIIPKQRGNSVSHTALVARLLEGVPAPV